MNSYARPALTYIPAWRGDETLYSWAASYHCVLGNGSARDTGSLLFGAQHACRERDAPSGINHFIEVTGGTLGGIQEILRCRCALGIFAPFLPPGRYEDVIDQGLRRGANNWTALLGMPASRLCRSSQLRSCPDCVKQDQTMWGMPRWRSPHQLPGAWLCLEHEALLTAIIGQKSVWELPSADGNSCPRTEPTRAQTNALARLARLAEFAYRSQQVDVEAVRQSVLWGLRERGLSSWSRVLDGRRLAAWFTSLPISLWLRERQECAAALSSGEWIHDLLRHRRENHPLKWLILWSSVFDDANNASDLRRFTDPGTVHCWDVSGQGNLWGPSDMDLPQDLFRLVSDASSLAEFATQLGLTSETLRHRLAAIGSKGVDVRMASRFPRKRESAINAIAKFIAHNPACSRSDIHRQCKAAVEWMRCNAPDAYDIATANLGYRATRQRKLEFD